jgi:hypothetical protein
MDHLKAFWKEQKLAREYHNNVFREEANMKEMFSMNAVRDAHFHLSMYHFKQLTKEQQNTIRSQMPNTYSVGLSDD